MTSFATRLPLAGVSANLGDFGAPMASGRAGAMSGIGADLDALAAAVAVFDSGPTTMNLAQRMPKSYASGRSDSFFGIGADLDTLTGRVAALDAGVGSYLFDQRFPIGILSNNLASIGADLDTLALRISLLVAPSGNQSIAQPMGMP
jgi:hypothetical protein